MASREVDRSKNSEKGGEKCRHDGYWRATNGKGETSREIKDLFGEGEIEERVQSHSGNRMHITATAVGFAGVEKDSMETPGTVAGQDAGEHAHCIHYSRNKPSKALGIVNLVSRLLTSSSL